MVQEASPREEQVLEIRLVILRNHAAVLKDNVAELTAESMRKFNQSPSSGILSAWNLIPRWLNLGGDREVLIPDPLTNTA